MTNRAVEVQSLSFRYQDRKALDQVSLSVDEGEIFGLLGPNGSGKTTLLRLLSTLIGPQSGKIEISGHDISRDTSAVRQLIGVVFQSPALDAKLTVMENLTYHGALYGLSGSKLRTESELFLQKVGLEARAEDKVEKLSGGLKRRVELAKGLLHKPKVLLLDEPSTGLDPGARLDLWRYLKKLKEEEKITIIVATHMMEEAENCNRVVIMNHGKVVAEGTPDHLKGEIGKDVIFIRSHDGEKLKNDIQNKFGLRVLIVGDSLQIEHEAAHRFIREIVEAFPGRIESVTFRKPTLEDVFIHKTGHRFWEEEVPVAVH